MWRCAFGGVLVVIALLFAGANRHHLALAVLDVLVGVFLIVESVLVLLNVRDAISKIDARFVEAFQVRPSGMFPRSPRAFAMFMIIFGALGISAPFHS